MIAFLGTDQMTAERKSLEVNLLTLPFIFQIFFANSCDSLPKTNWDFNTERPTKIGIASESVTGDGKSWYLSPEFTLSPRWSYKFEASHLSLNMVYHGEYTFNTGITANSENLPSGPVTSRRQNPFVYVKYEYENNAIKCIKAGWAHESNGMYITSTELRDTLQKISVFTENRADHYNSMGWNYYFLQVQFKIFDSIQIYLEDRLYHNQSNSAIFFPLFWKRNFLELEDENFSDPNTQSNYWNVDGLRISARTALCNIYNWPLSIFGEVHLPSLTTNLMHAIFDNEYFEQKKYSRSKAAVIGELNCGPREFQVYTQIKAGYANHITNYSVPNSAKITKSTVADLSWGIGFQSHIK